MFSLNINEHCPFPYFDSNMKIKLSVVLQLVIEINRYSRQLYFHIQVKISVRAASLILRAALIFSEDTKF